MKFRWLDSRGLGTCGPQNVETLNNNLNAMPYKEEPWLSAFPTLANILDVGHKIWPAPNWSKEN